jgi:hypothetical protein
MVNFHLKQSVKRETFGVELEHCVIHIQVETFEFWK